MSHAGTIRMAKYYKENSAKEIISIRDLVSDEQ
jgi:hypothetical protein